MSADPQVARKMIEEAGQARTDAENELAIAHARIAKLEEELSLTRAALEDTKVELSVIKDKKAKKPGKKSKKKS